MCKHGSSQSFTWNCPSSICSTFHFFSSQLNWCHHLPISRALPAHRACSLQSPDPEQPSVSSHMPQSYPFCKAQSVTRSSEKTSFDWKNLSLLWTPGTLTSFHPCIMYLLFNRMPCLPKWVILNPYRVKILFFIYYFSSTCPTLKVQWRLNSLIFVPQSCGSKETWMIMPPTDTQRSARQSGAVMGSRAEPRCFKILSLPATYWVSGKVI